MKYTDNPRKVYGLIEIIYIDAEISKDILTAVSCNSDISRPIEIYKGNITPTVKACTMDGNSTMDSSYQMLDETCVLGWLSKSLCDGSGIFAETKPYIEVSFVQRPIISWIIIGDDKLNQFPVDFNVTYYNGNKTIQTDKIESNINPQVKIEPKALHYRTTMIDFIINRQSMELNSGRIKRLKNSVYYLTKPKNTRK